MTETEWLYTLVQAGATFAAITGAFFTTKVFTIASEKRTLENHVREQESEIEERRKQIEELQERANQIEEADAAERVETLEDRFLQEIDVLNPPSADGMDVIFKKVTGVAPDQYEAKALRGRYSQFMDRVREEAFEKAEELEQEEEFKKLQEQAEKGDPSAAARLSVVLARRTFKPLYTLKTGIPKLPAIKSAYQIEQENELFQQLYDEKRNFAVLGTRLAENRSNLKALAFPRYVREGFLSLCYLLVATVVIPLGIAPWWLALPSYGELLIFSLFISGLFVTAGYLYLEIRYAMKPTTQTRDAAPQTFQLGESEEIKRMLVEHDVLSSLDAVLLLLMPLLTLGISLLPQLLKLAFPWQYLNGFIIIAVFVFIASLVLLVRSKLTGSIVGRAQAWAYPFIFLGAFAISVVTLAFVQSALRRDILIVPVQYLALVTFGSGFLGHALASGPTKWLASNLKDRMPWKSDEIEKAFSETPFVRASYIPTETFLVLSLAGLLSLLLFLILMLKGY